MKCWGRNNAGQLGVGDRVEIGALDSDFPPKSTSTFDSVSLLKSGGYNTCALSAEGDAKCWGSNVVLGPNRSTADSTDASVAPLLPVGQQQPHEQIVDVAIGLDNYCVIFSNLKMKCYGVNDSGVCGSGTEDPRGEEEDEYPLDNVDAGVLVQGISMSSNQICIVGTMGSVKCWGDWESVLGLGAEPTTNLSIGNEPGEMPPDPVVHTKDVTSIALGGRHACAIIPTNSTAPANGLKCWGYNSNGQLGLGDTNERGNNASEMFGLRTRFSDDIQESPEGIATSTNATCTVTSTGHIYCWGKATEIGQGMDIGTAPDKAAFRVDMGLAITSIASHGTARHFCAITEVGTVKCWGEDDYNQLGLGERAQDLDDPAQQVVLW